MRSPTKFLTWASILMIAGLFSCANEMDAFEESITTKTEEVHGKHHIPLSDALTRLESMLEAMNEEGQTRALQRGNWSVQRVPMSTFKTQTRSDNEDLSADALYVVNFEDNGGYAILSADDRLPDDVIAVTSSGGITFEPVTFDESTDTITLEMLYVAEDDDYLLGGGNNDIIQDLVTGYVIGWTDSLPSMEDEFGDLPLLPPGGDDDESDNNADTLVINYSYETDLVCNKMLQTKWCQHNPFNLYCDKRYYHYNIFGRETFSVKEYDFDYLDKWGDDYIRTEDLPAGCVAIAVAQILVYNRYPKLSDLINCDTTIKWDSLSLNANVQDSIQRHYQASLVHNIGVGCNMKYGFLRKKQSFATPAAAKQYMKSIGYEGLDVGWYNFGKVTSMLEDDCPVFVGALGTKSQNKGGHAWVIDGYKKIDKIKTIKRKSGGIVISRTVEETTDYVHCNWGWTDGDNNGWFANKLLEDKDLAVNNAESFDSASSQNYYYNFWFRMIEYNKPNVEQ